MNRHLGILLVLTIWALALVSCREKPPAATPTTAGTDVPAGRLNTPAPTGTDTPVGRLNTSSLSGRVTVAGSGQNLPGATVEAWLASSQSNDDVAQPWLAGQANGAISTKTDAGGYYAFYDLPEGDYVVRAYAPGYAREYYDNQAASHAARVIHVQASKEMDGVDFELSEGGSISGQILQSDGVTPIAGAEVLVRPSKYFFDQGFWTRTDSNGQYRVDHLYLGAYRVTVRAEGYVSLVRYYRIPQEVMAPTPIPGRTPEPVEQARWIEGPLGWLFAQDVMVIPPIETSGTNIRLERGGMISGRVYAADGVTPLPSIRIAVDDATGLLIESFGNLTQEDGSYRIEGIPAGTYTVRVAGDPLDRYAGEYYDAKNTRGTADRIMVSEGSETPDINFNLEQGGRITGHVYDAETDKPLEDIQLFACLPDGDCGLAPVGKTSYDGSYSIVLGPGEYRLRAGYPGMEVIGLLGNAYLPEWYKDADNVKDATLLNLTSGQELSGIDLTLAHTGSLSGYVFDQQGYPVSGARVFANSYGIPVDGANTQPDGSYQITGIPSGGYTIMAVASGYAAGTSDYVGVNAPSETSGVDFHLKRETSLIIPEIRVEITEVVLDDENIYWITQSSDDLGMGTISSMPKEGGEARKIADGITYPRGLMLDEEHLYWVSGSGPKYFITRVGKQDGNLSTFWSDKNEITSLEIDRSNLYWVTCSQQPEISGTIWKMSKSVSTPEIITTSSACPSLMLSGPSIYWVDDGLKAVSLGGGEVTTILADPDLRYPELGIGFRDDRSYAMPTRVVWGDAAGVYFLVHVDNLPGMVSCTDQHDTLIRRLNEGGEYQHLVDIPGGATSATGGKIWIGFTSHCDYFLTIVNTQTGDKTQVEWDASQKVVALDGTHIYWIGQDGRLKVTDWGER